MEQPIIGVIPLWDEKADDGLVEAVYMPERSYVWAVQWHPEFSLKDEISKKIFSSFVGSVERGFS